MPHSVFDCLSIDCRYCAPLQTVKSPYRTVKALYNLCGDVAPRPTYSQVQKHTLVAPGGRFLAWSGAKTPLFCTRRQVFGGVRCKNASILHPEAGFRRGPVQKHPSFAPGGRFLADSGAKTPLFCTGEHVFGVVRCKNTPYLHLDT